MISGVGKVVLDVEDQERAKAFWTTVMGFELVQDAAYDGERWLEVSSCSNFGDFQARRAQIRFKDPASKEKGFVHTLNGSGLALPRTLIETFNRSPNADGSVARPTLIDPARGTSRQFDWSIGSAASWQRLPR